MPFKDSARYALEVYEGGKWRMKYGSDYREVLEGIMKEEMESEPLTAPRMRIRENDP